MLAQERRNQLLEMVRSGGLPRCPNWPSSLMYRSQRCVGTWTSWRTGVCQPDPRRSSLYRGFAEIAAFRLPTAGPMGTEEEDCSAGGGLVEEGDTILLDGGSTTYELARLLVGRPVHVVTNSLPVANLFVSDTASDLVLIGGNICPRTGVSRTLRRSDVRHVAGAQDDPQRGRD